MKNWNLTFATLILTLVTFTATGCAVDGQTTDAESADAEYNTRLAGALPFEHQFVSYPALDCSSENSANCIIPSLDMKLPCLGESCQKTDDTRSSTCLTVCTGESQTAAEECSNLEFASYDCEREMQEVFTTCMMAECSAFDLPGKPYDRSDNDHNEIPVVPEVDVEETVEEEEQVSDLSPLEQCIVSCEDLGDKTYLQCVSDDNSDAERCRNEAIELARVCIEQHCPTNE